MAASDLANLFGLNNKQESMDTARIASFEPGTFKPIMAGPEVAQGVAAGLFNMGNAVFGADCTESYRQERYNIMGVATETAVREWENTYGMSRDVLVKNSYK